MKKCIVLSLCFLTLLAKAAAETPLRPSVPTGVVAGADAVALRIRAQGTSALRLLDVRRIRGGPGGWKMAYRRPSDDNATRPAVIEHPDAQMREPVWVDLRTGRVYAFPKDRMLVHSCGVTFVDVPVYDSPCVLTEKSALQLMR